MELAIQHEQNLVVQQTLQALGPRDRVLSLAPMADIFDVDADQPVKFSCAMCKWIGPRELGTTFGDRVYCANCSRQCPVCQCYGPRSPRWWNHYHSALICRICYTFAMRDSSWKLKDQLGNNGLVPGGFRPDTFYDPTLNATRLQQLCHYCDIGPGIVHEQVKYMENGDNYRKSSRSSQKRNRDWNNNNNNNNQ
jgi:hypothetical protein